jgi:hypothetical protein
MRVRPFGACIVTCLVGSLAAAVAGCGAAGNAGEVAATAAPWHATASSSSPAAPATAAPLDATTLNSELLTVADMPKGYTVASSVTRYNAAALPDDSPSPVPAANTCAILAQTAWIRASGIDTPDFAQAGFVNSANTEEISEEIDAFQGADAQKAMTALWQAFGHCATFTEPYSGTTAKMTLSRSMIGGQWSGIKSVLVSPAFAGGETMVAIRAGYAIVTVIDSVDSSDEGSAAVSMAERIASRLSAAEAAR